MQTYLYKLSRPSDHPSSSFVVAGLRFWYLPYTEPRSRPVPGARTSETLGRDRKTFELRSCPIMSPSRRSHPTALPTLPLTTRILVLVLGWLLILVGIAGLVLPGLQGILTLLLGGALLSLVSPSMLRALRYTMRPWPAGWRRLLRLRRKLVRKLGADSRR